MHPHLMDDLDNLCGMIASKDSGYFLPPTERILAMNGDKASAIELMFPNRPELMNYAWDGRSDANVSIVPKKDYTAGAKGKVSGYLVGYNNCHWHGRDWQTCGFQKGRHGQDDARG